MSIKLEEYISNPMGKNNAVMPAFTREAIKRGYAKRFDNLLLRENGKINYYLYKDSNKNIYYAHIKVPSEVVPKFYYDVVFKFFADSKVKELGRNLEKYYVELFSNDPAFVFNYTHTFMKNGLFINELRAKMSREAIKTRAKERNPKDINGYVKSIYFAYLFMKQRGLLKTVSFGGAESFDIKKILSRIEHADKKILERQEEGAKISKKKKVNVDNNTLSNISKIDISDEAKSRLVTTTKRTVGVKHTKAVNNKTKGVKRSKRI